jgi:hypothetical protein
VNDDRSGLAQGAAVVEDESRDAQGGVETPEQLRPVRAVEHRDLLTLIGDPEMCEEQPSLSNSSGVHPLAV